MKKTIGDIKKKTEQLLRPFNHFFNNEAASGFVLLLCAVLAMIIANTALNKTYEQILHMQFSLMGFNLSILHWVNDGLMAVFFFTVGMEIKREVLFGELQSISATILPIVAAIAGMIVPALLYSAVNIDSGGLAGWGIPMSTDIAFSLGVLSMAAGNVPRSIAVFLTTLAVVDDLGAIIVIALFYSNSVSLTVLLYGLAALAAALAANKLAVKNIFIYLFWGVIAWFFFYNAGVHPTIAGVILGLLIPADKSQNADKSLLHKLEYKVVPFSTWVVMPIFALVNAGVKLDMSNFANMEGSFLPIAAGIILGLTVGKPLGIFGVTALLFKFKVIKMPEKTSYIHFLGAGSLGGIGFTMSLFIASLAFSGSIEYLTAAKVGIIIASCLSGLLGMIILKLTNNISTVQG
ncbi:Na+/H+ antiporter NhaA [Pectinatus frisingensis]|uniref:Na+/H+ antiporter NhaA n=1 Tax=Pectinatus frisingensis TaxID=865 RepID=UPI0018C54C3F|nr:Na+/H+ antiporter NhaA [Pectinatus frisingensis]